MRRDSSENTISIQETVRTKSERAEHKSYKVVQKHDKVWTKSKSESKNTVYKKKSEGTKSFLSFSCTTFFDQHPLQVYASRDFQMLFVSISFSSQLFVHSHDSVIQAYFLFVREEKVEREKLCVIRI